MQCVLGGNAAHPLVQPVINGQVLGAPSKRCEQATARSEQGNEGSSGSKRRRAAADEFHTWLVDNFETDSTEVNVSDKDRQEVVARSSSDMKTEAMAPKRLNKRGRPMSGAAIAKAERERARRERLNEFFDELARLCDPSGKAGKSDRVSIVADAVRVIQQLRVENNQLRQLNKFLEERCGHLERARAQVLYQQVAPGGLPLQVEPSSNVDGVVSLENNSNADKPTQEQMNVPVRIDRSSFVQQNGRKQMGISSSSLEGHCTAPELFANTQTTGWLPAPDVSEDQKLRPPAA